MKKSLILFLSIILFSGCAKSNFSGTKGDKSLIDGSAIGALTCIPGASFAGAMLLYWGSGELNSYDRQKFNFALEHGKSYEVVSWKNPDTAITFLVIPHPAYKKVVSIGGKDRNVPCRNADVEFLNNGESTKFTFTAYRTGASKWKIIKP